MKQRNEVENLLALIFQSGGQVIVKDGQLLVGPKGIARRFGDQIRRLKPDLIQALGHTHCPVCGRELVIESGQLSIKNWAEKSKTGEHSCCPDSSKKHFDKWEF